MTPTPELIADCPFCGRKPTLLLISASVRCDTPISDCPLGNVAIPYDLWSRRQALSRERGDALEEAAKVLHGMGDSAYVRGSQLSKQDLCLGEEHKISTGAFTLANLKAIEMVRGKFGEATGLWNGEKAIRALAKERA